MPYVLIQCHMCLTKVICAYPSPAPALQIYAEASRMGTSGGSILSMDFDFASQPGKPEMLLSMDVNDDCVVIINSEGLIMVVSAGASPLFGYDKTELEGQNVSMLMPQPFSGRHNSYLQHYKDFPDQPRILDSVKEVVALHKDRTVFPVTICVTKLSGVGADAIFLGMLRPLSFSRKDIRAWLAPNGTIMCSGPMFSALTGIESATMLGTNVKNLMADPSRLEALLQRAAHATPAEFEGGHLKVGCSATYLGTQH